MHFMLQTVATLSTNKAEKRLNISNWTFKIVYNVYFNQWYNVVNTNINKY